MKIKLGKCLAIAALVLASSAVSCLHAMYNAQVEGTRRSGESSTKIHLRWMDVKTWKTHAVVLNSDTGIGDFRRYVAYVWGVAPAKVILILDGERLVDDNWVLGQRTRTDPILIHALDEPAVPYDW